ncbi:MAG: hypothetical protein JWN93_788 [Hyphomicrobiales bacterium]|nr:hypothetical protein [Hyphomicrobiales bacterium]
MDKFQIVRGPAAPLLVDDVDTDQIAPVQYMRALEPDYRVALFARWRAAPQDFVLDKPRFSGAPILVAGRNFGCGSAREVAVWALMAHGVRCIVARSFSDVFRESALKNGVLPVQLDAADQGSFEAIATDVDGAAPFEVDLVKQIIQCPGGRVYAFSIAPHERAALLQGLDDVALTMAYAARIAAWEEGALQEQPWLQRVPPRKG